MGGKSGVKRKSVSVNNWFRVLDSGLACSKGVKAWKTDAEKARRWREIERWMRRRVLYLNMVSLVRNGVALAIDRYHSRFWGIPSSCEEAFECSHAMLFVPWRPFLSFRQKTQSPCTPSLVGMTRFITIIFNAACIFQSPGKKIAREKKFMAHGKHVACKTDIEAKKEPSSSSQDSAERAICREGLAGAGQLAAGIDGGFSVSEGKSQHSNPVGIQTVVRAYLKVKPTNNPLPIFSSRSAMFSNAVCLSCTSLYLAISASLLKSSK